MNRTQEHDATIQQLVDRLARLPRILAGHNRRLGRPLDEHDLADLCQDTAVILLQKRHLFDDGVPLEGWVYRVCAMEIRNSVRRKLRRAALATDDSVDVPIQGESPTSEAFVRRHLVRDVLARLEPEESELIRMKNFEAFTFDEIADRLDLAPSTLKTRYYRALARLQVLLQPAHRESPGWD